MLPTLYEMTLYVLNDPCTKPLVYEVTCIPLVNSTCYSQAGQGVNNFPDFIHGVPGNCLLKRECPRHEVKHNKSLRLSPAIFCSAELLLSGKTRRNSLANRHLYFKNPPAAIVYHLQPLQQPPALAGCVGVNEFKLIKF